MFMPKQADAEAEIEGIGDISKEERRMEVEEGEGEEDCEEEGQGYC